MYKPTAQSSTIAGGVTQDSALELWRKSDWAGGIMAGVAVNHGVLVGEDSGRMDWNVVQTHNTETRRRVWR